ncbi:NAD/FAD-dependent oxidoreductase [Verrucomicrobia bacterium LW23]|nr:NAD/FAD-dependent oxidoreductase [Verrucomicrobia bacterium LW23]
MKTEEIRDVLIVGAGISGLLAAKTLHSGGANLLVVDKARGVGGRLATRRMGSGVVVDHGAQYFTVTEPQFSAIVDDWKLAGIVRPWAHGFRLQDGTLKSDGKARYVGTTGMTAMAKDVARSLPVRLDTRIARLEVRDSVWLATTEAGDRIFARALLLTAPVPQSLALLNTVHAALPDTIKAELEQIQYSPCLALLARLERPSSAIPEPGGMWLAGGPLSWMADNGKKGISGSDHAALTLHASAGYSEANWESSAEEITATLLEAAAPWLGSPVLETQLHRWRYSLPKQTYPERCVAVASPAPLVLAGDAFGGPRVEGAALSGLAAGAVLAKMLR